MTLVNQLINAQNAARLLSQLSNRDKNNTLKIISRAIFENRKLIFTSNQKDLQQAEEKGRSVMLDRLMLNEKRLKDICRDIINITKLENPVGKIIESKILKNGLKLNKVTCPLGVIGMIYESRPNVTIDASCLALKSGNAIVLKGGSDALETNRALVKTIKTALKKTKISPEAIQFIDSDDRNIIHDLLHQKKYIDVIIPRGGKNLIDFVSQNSTIPIIETGASVVHTYVDEKVELKKAVDIIINSKTQRPSVCNALDTLLVHSKIAPKILPALALEFAKFNVEIRADQESYQILKPLYQKLKPALIQDFDTEFLDYILAVKIVRNLDQALDHIFKHSLKHSEAIITTNKKNADRFLKEVDAAAVYVNASTRFTDGAQFGLGAEIGISTQKLHARGPFALDGLVTYKWTIIGNGQVRP